MPLLILPVVGVGGYLYGLYSSDTVKSLMWIMVLAVIAYFVWKSGVLKKVLP